MISMIIWVLALAGSIAAICLTVALDAQNAHLAATALASFGIVAAAVNDHRTAQISGASRYTLAAAAARYTGLLWAWSAISAYVVYAFLLDWPYWMPVVVAMFVGCGVCLFIAAVLDRETTAENPDVWATIMVGVLAKGHFALGGLMLGCLIALRRQPEMVMGGAHRWVALNLILCTSGALLSLAGYLILSERDTIAAADTDSTVQSG